MGERQVIISTNVRKLPKANLTVVGGFTDCVPVAVR